MERRWLTVEELAAYINFARPTIYSWVCRRKIPFTRRGGRIRFDRVVIDSWMAEGAQSVVEASGGKNDGG